MPRLNRGVPKYGHHKPSGQAVVKFADKAHYLGAYDSPESREKYDRLIAEYLACGRNPHLINAEKQSVRTVASLLLAFIQHADSYYRKNGELTTEFTAYKLVIRATLDLYRDLPVAEFGPRRLKAVRESWLQQ